MPNQRFNPAGKKQPLAVAASPGGRLLRESSRGRHLIPALVGNQRAEGGAREMPAQPEGDYVIRPSRPVKRHLLSGSQAASAVEFALLLPVLVLLICGIIDFGFMFYNWNVVNEASREAARYAATNKSVNNNNPPTKAEVQTYINGIYPNVSLSQLTPNPPTSTNPVTATVTYSYTIMTPIIRAFFTSNPVTLTGTTTMLVE